MIDFKLPSLGADMDEGKLLEWKVKVGDKVKRGDVVAVVDTSKAAVEVEIWNDGVVQELLVEPGKTVPVGTIMARLSGAGEEEPKIVEAVVEKPKIQPPSHRRRISPAARKHAEEHGIDVEAVQGTGPDGAVILEDVEKLIRGMPAKVSPVEVPKEIQKPVDRALAMRQAIAAAMSRSKREIPHYYLAETIPMLRATEWLARENEKRPLAGRILMAVLQIKAVALALGKFPELNGFYRDGAHQPSKDVHVGVAISLRGGGLVAPAIHDVPGKGLDALMKDLMDLVKRARAGSLRSSEMADPTITVTNLGEGGVESVFPIIYPPQVAIVGFGTLAQRPWVAPDGGLHVAPTVVASLGGDHRASDGHRGALFLAELSRLLQQPETL